jgi:hypothetical protein
MSAHDDVSEFVRLVRANSEVASVAGGCDPALIAAAEAKLDVTFPPSYAEFLRQLGECDIAGEEFYGVWIREDEPDTFYGAVRTTLNARKSSDMPRELVGFMSDGMGGIYVLDTASAGDDGEAPVLVWVPGGSVPRGILERVSGSFGEFALFRTRAALAAFHE